MPPLQTWVFFDRITEADIASADGRIRQCFDEYFNDYVISDELRKMLLMEESEQYSLYSEQERQELIFRLFSHFVVGGGLCQQEDNVGPYIETTKNAYKDLLSVRPNRNTGKVEVASSVYQINAVTPKGSSSPLSIFTSPYSPFNLCFVTVDASKKQLAYYYFSYVSW